MRKIEKSHQALWLTSLLLIPAVLLADNAACAETSDSSDLLLNLFVEKGYVSKSEAEKVKVEAEKRQAQLEQYKAQAESLRIETEALKAELAELKTHGNLNFNPTNSISEASKWKVSNGVKNLELFGDVRLRYESREVKDAQNGKIGVDRERYCVRLGLRGDLLDNFNFGFRLESSSNPRSPWNTFGASSSGVPYQGPFGKSTAGINIGQAYIGWHLDDWADITLGKMPNPLYTTPMVWDNDLSPEGISEKFKYTVGEADFFATFGQFINEDTNPTKASGGYFGLANSGNYYSGNGTPPFLLAFQGGVNYRVTKKVSFKLAPVIYYYAGQGVDTTQPISGSSGLYAPGFGNTYIGQGAVSGEAAGASGYPVGDFNGFSANQTGINDLLVLEVPLEVNFKLDRFHLRFFGDYAYNFEGAQRATAAYNAISAINTALPQNYPIQPIASAQTQDVKAYQFGFGIGSTNLIYGPMQGLVYGNSSKKHAWEFRTYWQHIEQYALDPNLIDSDLFEGRENMEGVYAAFAYGLSDNVIATVRYGYAKRINEKLGTGGSNQDIPQMNPINSYSLLQVDLGVKF